MRKDFKRVVERLSMNKILHTLYKNRLNYKVDENLEFKIFVDQSLEDFTITPGYISSTDANILTLDESVMKIAKEKGIVFNVCPTSNIVLGYAKNLEEHPIKRMVEFGLKVIIATDDLLFFNSDNNEEYLKLYQAGTLSAEQLDNIRLFGLSSFNDNHRH